ncbi:ABC transporter ATP-binding protein/permease [Actinomadura sp. ATCC 31491]|uniref:ABC transporter ATP-binding protein/permease n=1 Tax=Actinomadura luzonensis TaxID=2805427 RepID=A0ABT0FNY8_9ACTN|nr:ABC transporter ATP-binding protein [Actinomadura luzonensis]MCK2213720.1 ABC transporter ATP-binding protein/permease [Actinomadura luzonensis]
MRARTADPAAARVTRRDGDRLLAATARGVWASLLVTGAAVALSTAAALALPAALAAAVDGVVSGDSARAARLLALVLAAAVCAELVSGLAGAEATASATAALRLRLVSHLLRLDASRARRLPPGELVNRLVGNTGTVGRVPLTLLHAVTELISTTGGIVMLLVTDWRSGVAFVAGLPVVLVILRLFVTRLSGAYERYQGAQGRLSARLTETLAGIRTVRASGTEDREIARVLRPLAELSEAGHEVWRTQARSVWQVSLLLPLIEVLVLVVAGLGVTDGRLQPGQLLAVAGYAAMGVGFVEQVNAVLGVAEARVAARRIQEVLLLPPLVPGTRPLPPGPGALSLRGVTVVREGARLLDGVDLDLVPGSLTALVGPSGAGKTTLALLAGRLLDPDHGRVLLDGHDVAELAPRALSDAVAYAFERPVLLGGDLAAAIAYGRPELSLDQVRRAAWAAHVDDVVRRLPGGYRTPAASAPLSGGEFQRLGLARAMVRRARLTVLDDATSSLDTATEAQVTRALAEGMRGTTRLVVAHRAATAARADRVVWLDGGRVVAQGRHAELWRHPAYRALFAGGEG